MRHRPDTVEEKVVADRIDGRRWPRGLDGFLSGWLHNAFPGGRPQVAWVSYSGSFLLPLGFAWHIFFKILLKILVQIQAKKFLKIWANYEKFGRLCTY